MRHLLLIAALGIGLTACGGGGGGGGSKSPGVTYPAALPARSLPDHDVAVTQLDAPAPGGTLRLRITVSNPATVASVGARLGTAYEEATPPAATATATAGVYEIALPVPSPVPAGLRAWVRVTGTDGSVVESGIADFAIVR